MIKLGEYNELEVKNFTDFGLYLGIEDSDDDHTILLPKKEIPEGTEISDILNVFIYKDSEDREIATTQEVPLTIGTLALLKVKEINNIGTFLDWSLLKDLLLPYKEQTAELAEGDEVLVTLYIDKSDRLCATMKLYEYLSGNSPYAEGEEVSGIIYELIDNFGAFVSVDKKYSALIPNNEIFQPLEVGQNINARITKLDDEGRLTLSLRQEVHIQMSSDALMIMSKLEAADGFLPFHDKSKPEDIKKEFQLSKNAFKRAIGSLYKAQAITIEENGIKLKPDN